MTWTLAAARIDETPRKPPILAALQGLAARDSATGRSRLPHAFAGPAPPVLALQADRKGLVRPRGPAPSRSRSRSQRRDCLDLDWDPMGSTTCYSDARANQTLDQTAAIVQRHGESTSPPLISFAVRSQEAQSQSRMRRGRLVVQCSLAVQPFDHVEWSV